MPTATSNTSSGSTRSHITSNDGSNKSSLRILYDQAKHAFLKRNLSQTYSILTNAFTMIQPPTTLEQDELSSHRRKWDILRITLLTTLYTTPNHGVAKFDGASLPPIKFVHLLRARSLELFTPVGVIPSLAHVPPQVVLLLIVSALKLDALEQAKEITEDWLARRAPISRGDESSLSPNIDGKATVDLATYEKILDVYCLHVLTRLELWDDAKEFLKYEEDLPIGSRLRILQALETDYAKAITPCASPSTSKLSSTNGANSFSSNQSDPPRPHSSASVHSSASTATVRPFRRPTAAETSISIVVDPSEIAPPNQQNTIVNLNSPVHNPLPTPPSSPPDYPAELSPSSPTTRNLLGMLQTSIRQHLQPHESSILRLKAYLSSLSLYQILIILIPLALVWSRIRSGRKSNPNGKPGAIQSAGDVTRNRLQKTGPTGLSGMWKELIHAIGDAVLMGGRGLV